MFQFSFNNSWKACHSRDQSKHHRLNQTSIKIRPSACGCHLKLAANAGDLAAGLAWTRKSLPWPGLLKCPADHPPSQLPNSAKSAKSAWSWFCCNLITPKVSKQVIQARASTSKMMPVAFGLCISSLQKMWAAIVQGLKSCEATRRLEIRSLWAPSKKKEI